MFTRARVLSLALVMLFLSAAAASAATRKAPKMIRIPGHVLPVLAHATEVKQPFDARGHLSHDSDPIAITIVLKRDDQAGFDRYLKDIYDSHSKNFHRYLKQRQIADQFGPSRAAYNRVLAYMRGRGFKLVRGSHNRLTITLRGDRAAAEQAFDIGIRDYHIAQRSFYANDQDPALPPEIARLVKAVEGLSDLAWSRPATDAIKLAYANAICPDQAAADPASYIPDCDYFCQKDNGGFFSVGDSLAQCLDQCDCNEAARIKEVYDKCFSDLGVASQYNATGLKIYQAYSSFCGTGSAGSSAVTKLNARAAAAEQTVGLLEFDSFKPSDISDYAALLGLPTTVSGNVTKVDVDGGVQPGPDESEVLLDINALLTAAPGVAVRVYDAPFTGAGSFVDVFQQMINDNVSVIANSWASCEDQVSQADAQAIDTVFQQAAVAGISVFNGTGDSGSTCLNEDPLIRFPSRPTLLMRLRFAERRWGLEPATFTKARLGGMGKTQRPPPDRVALGSASSSARLPIKPDWRRPTPCPTLS